jgi:hypothetical protein
MRSIYCDNCGALLGVEGPLPLHQRGRCKWCGSTDRRLEENVTDGLQIRDAIHLNGIESTTDVGTLRIWGSPATVREKKKYISWMEPTGKDGAFTAMVHNENGDLIDMSVQKEWEDAVLAVIERLGPEQES